MAMATFSRKQSLKITSTQSACQTIHAPKGPQTHKILPPIWDNPTKNAQLVRRELSGSH